MINALAFATANKAALGIDVINLSLGHPIYESVATDPLVQAVEAAEHGLRRYYISGQLTVRDHRRGSEHLRHAGAR